MGWSLSVKNYYKVTKPNVWSLLVFTGFSGAIVATEQIGYIPVTEVLLLTLAIALGSAGANTVTCYIDRDIDFIMKRTAQRPIPSGEIHPPEKALYYGLILVALSLIISFIVHPLSSLFMFIGVFDNIVIYSLLLKRRTSTNVLLGGMAGSMPVLVGFVGIANSISPLALALAGLVFLWIPTHIWSLALRWREDYMRVKVPMLPIIAGEKASARTIALMTIMMVVFSIYPIIVQSFGYIYLIAAISFGLVILGASVWLMVRPIAQRAWIVFKLSSPYLAIIFAAMVIDTLFY